LTKTKTYLDFYKYVHYDGVGLSSRETAMGISQWEDFDKQGYPILAANLFVEAKGGFLHLSKVQKPLFKQYLIKQDHGERLGVIAFVSDAAWKAAAKDSTQKVIYQSPFACGKLIKKVAKQCDHLTVTGEFTKPEVDSLVRVFPEIKLVLTSSTDNAGMAIPVGKSAVVIGSGTRGYTGNYVDWNFSKPDTVNPYTPANLSLDGAHGEDTLMLKLISAANVLISQGK
jgi:hypothetical protein